MARHSHVVTTISKTYSSRQSTVPVRMGAKPTYDLYETTYPVNNWDHSYLTQRL